MDEEKLKQLLADLQKNLSEQIAAKVGEQSTKADEDIAGLKTQLEEVTNQYEELKKNLEEKKKLIVPGLEEELKHNPFSWSKFAFAALAASKGSSTAWEKAGHEKEIIDEHTAKMTPQIQKDHIAGDGTQGGYLIPEEVTSEIVGLTIANMPIMGMGVTSLTGLYGDLPIPRITGRNTGYWVGETEPVTESTGTFGQFTLRPKKGGAFTKFSRELSYQTKGIADRIIKENLSDSLALLIHQGLWSGLGTEQQPKGIANSANLALMTTTPNWATNGARFRVDKMASMIQALDTADELKDGGSFGFLMRPEVIGGLKRERIPQFTGQPIGQGMPLSMANVLMTPEQLSNIVGYPIKTTTQISATTTRGTSSTCSIVLFGNWKQFYVGFWRGMEIRVSDQASDQSGNSAFLKDQFFMVAFQQVDCNIGRATAFTYVGDAETAEASWSNG